MTNRRSFLRAAGAVVAGLATAPAGAAARPRPSDVGRKFAADGRVIPFRGNTIICHLAQQGPDADFFDGLLDVFRELPAHRFAAKMTATPPSSYHMTIFGGANDKERRLPLWPSDLPLNLPIEDCNRILGERLRSFALGEDAPPYRMKVLAGEPDKTETPLTIRLVPADQDTEAKLRRLRNRLSAALNIRDPNHDRYGFHVTLGYTIQWLNGAENLDFRQALGQWRAMLSRRAPVLTLGAPEYCTLDDMFAFKRQFFLA